MSLFQPITPFCWDHHWTMVKDPLWFGWRCPVEGCEKFASKESVYRFGMDWEQVHQPCCTSCRGTGISGDIETNGRCWDCRGTGHVHPSGLSP